MESDGRLAYYRAAADDAYWDQHWQAVVSEAHYVDAEAGLLGRFESMFIRWLPRDGRILEAGCGTGFYLAGLRKRGYDVVGVEWGQATVDAVRQIKPSLPIQVGDVTQLDEPDGAFAGYISLGVMEHRQAGPEPFLQEAFRLLRPGGVALISVPSMHPLRRIKAKLGGYSAEPNGREFYQYAYPRGVFTRFAELAGFRVVDAIAYDGYKGIKDELPGSEKVLRLFKKSRWTKRRLERCRFGHMMMFVCEKPVRREAG